MAVSFIIANDIAFQALIKKVGKDFTDLRPLFEQIRDQWFKSNRKLFALRGAGLYQPLAPSKGFSDAGNITTTSNYAERKKKLLGFSNPILRGRTRALENSITSHNAPNAVSIITRQTLIMGTDNPIAIFHQSDKPRKKIPQRKMIFIDGGPAERARDASISGRIDVWTVLADDYIRTNLKKRGF